MAEPMPPQMRRFVTELAGNRLADPALEVMAGRLSGALDRADLTLVVRPGPDEVGEGAASVVRALRDAGVVEEVDGLAVGTSSTGLDLCLSWVQAPRLVKALEAVELLAEWVDEEGGCSHPVEDPADDPVYLVACRAADLDETECCTWCRSSQLVEALGLADGPEATE